GGVLGAEGQRIDVEEGVCDDRSVRPDGLEQRLEQGVRSAVDVTDRLQRDLRVDQVPRPQAEAMEIPHQLFLAEGDAGRLLRDGPHGGAHLTPPSPRPSMRSTLRRTARARFSMGGPMRLPSSSPTPRPFSRPSSIAWTIRRASRISSSEGAKIRLAIETW